MEDKMLNLNPNINNKEGTELTPKTLPTQSPSKSHQSNRRKPIIITLSIIIVILMLVIIYFIIRQFAHPADNNAANGSNQDSTAISAEDQKLIQHAKEIAVVQNLVSETKAEISQFLVTTLSNEHIGDYQVSLDFYKEYNEGFPVIKPAGAKAYIPLNESYGFGIFAPTFQSFFTDEILLSILNQNELQLMETFFTAKGFSRDAETNQYINTEANIICTSLSSGVPQHFACSSMSWYDEAQINLVNELASVYGENMIFHQVSVEDSTYSPYQKASASIGARVGGGLALYYRTSPDSTWQFFASAQSVLSCDQYNTDDVKRAFAGDTCYDTATGQNSTVQS